MNNMANIEVLKTINEKRSNSVLDMFDSVARASIMEERPEEMLIEFYFAFFRQLKRRACVSSGFTGIAEYIFYRAISFLIECQTKQTFEVKEVTTEVNKLESPTLILTHDVRLDSIGGKK